MKRYFFLFIFCLFVFVSAEAQHKDFNRNVISTNIYSPFLEVSSYSLSYERVLDKGYSPTVSQFSYKISGILVRDTDKAGLYEWKGNTIYDLDAVAYDGYSALAELRYYFLWHAPVGYYISVFGAYTDVNEVYTDRRNPPYFLVTDTQVSSVSRGLGVGSQYRLHRSILVDILIGYRIDDVNEKETDVNTNIVVNKDPSTEDGLYISINFGVSF